MSVVEERLSHALLLEAASGSNDYFIPLFKSFLCLNALPSGEPCERCSSCMTSLNLEDANNRVHPDFWLVRPEGDSGYLVEQVQAWQKFMHLAKNLSPRKLLVIDNADKLVGNQTNAANAILKILEEPRPDSFLILLTASPQKLLATIRSRCLKISFREETTALAVTIGTGNEALEEIALLLTRGQLRNKSPLATTPWWKNRADRLKELGEVHQLVWRNICLQSKDNLLQGDLKNIWDRWNHFEDFLRAVKLYGNPPLHWLKLKMKIKGGVPWTTSKLFA